jgi:hypothetical protein
MHNNGHDNAIYVAVKFAVDIHALHFWQAFNLCIC